MATPLAPPGPALLTADQAKFIGLPPKPFEPFVALTQPGGQPTAEFHRYLTLHYEWERRLIAVLTGIG